MNIPTSLIVVLLVAAWLVVLLPMVARSRERVPETDDHAAGFRVLRRASASLRARSTATRRRPGLVRPGRRRNDANGSTDHAADTWDAEEASMTQVIQDQGQEPADAAEEWAAAQAAAQQRAGARGGSSPLRVGNREGAEAAGPALALADRPAHDPEHDPSEDEGVAAPISEPEGVRPVPRRAGRGGYDPEADEATRQYRYAQRRRVTFGLLLATLAFVVLALVLSPSLWIGAAVAGLLLVGYLLYLRRQVKIEADIRRRRQERLARARQIRPEYGPPRVHRAEPGVPVSRHHIRRVVVDLDDEDPGFDDLEQYQPVEYRRAVGQ